MIDSRMNWQPHVDGLAKRLRSSSAALTKIKNMVPFKTIKIIYHALIESLIKYGITSWGRENKNNMEKIQKIQDRVIKNIMTNKQNKKYNKINQKYEFTNLLTVDKLLMYKTIIENYQKYTSKIDSNISNTYSFRKKSATIPLTYNKYGDRTDNNFIQKTFNLVPNNLRTIKSKSKLKTEIKLFLMKNSL